MNYTIKLFFKRHRSIINNKTNLFMPLLTFKNPILKIDFHLRLDYLNILIKNVRCISRKILLDVFVNNKEQLA